MRNVIVTSIFMCLLSLSTFASTDLVTAVKPFVKHPAVVTRTYHGTKTLGKYTYKGVKETGKVTYKVGKVGKRILF